MQRTKRSRRRHPLTVFSTQIGGLSVDNNHFPPSQPEPTSNSRKETRPAVNLRFVSLVSALCLISLLLDPIQPGVKVFAFSSPKTSAIITSRQQHLHTVSEKGWAALRPIRPQNFPSLTIYAKPKRNSEQSTEDEPIPANLRRKVQARRPFLGHVVPASNRRQQQGGSGSQLSTLQAQGKERGKSNPSMLRIMAGRAKGRRLESPEVYLRPMMGKVKEAVFSTFTSFGLYDSACRHLDIFAGSGSVGLESLSRGASHCTFVDLSADCTSTVERNLLLCEFGSEEMGNMVVQGDALAVLQNPQAYGVAGSFQIITLCPPYEEIVYGDLLESVVNSPAVTDDTVVLVEYPIELKCLPHVIPRQDGGAMIGVRNRKYGRTVIAMYIVNPTGRLENAVSRPEEFVTL